MSEIDLPENEVKILLVDDEVNITKALRRLLMDVDQYDIHIANSGQEALALLADEPNIGVIISDQRMPEMTGVEFLKEARALVPDAVRILLTGYADIEASIAAINQGAVFRYLTKPWDDETLLQAIAEAARNYLLLAENKRLNTLVLKQKEELYEWNNRLKHRVLDQTSQIRAKSDELALGNQRLRSSFNETIGALAGIVEMRDRRAPGHSRNVAELVTVIAEKLGLPDAEKNQLRSAGLLHDIGKIGMSDKLLSKLLHSLDSKELQEYQNHVVRGQAAIDMVPALREIGVLIRHHHERFDGRGFPDKLKGDAIPLGARIICAADMFERKLIQFAKSDALSSALKELECEWGKSLDSGLRIALEEGAQEVYRHLDISAEVLEAKVSPKELEVGMQLGDDLYSGTGVLLLKQGTVFSEKSIEAVNRCFMIDPFERDIRVLIKCSEPD
ncbi:MAG: response regulator [Desulfuromusa sp.]|jgi:response regulator RpfG family c-di-GMP phosphodiesterase|nr:response regulator [Desulfuromusa sp.]